jgi:hypothetical protein
MIKKQTWAQNWWEQVKKTIPKTQKQKTQMKFLLKEKENRTVLVRKFCVWGIIGDGCTFFVCECCCCCECSGSATTHLAFDTFYFSGLIISLKRNFLFLSLHSLGLGERRKRWIWGSTNRDAQKRNIKLLRLNNFLILG